MVSSLVILLLSPQKRSSSFSLSFSFSFLLPFSFSLSYLGFGCSSSSVWCSFFLVFLKLILGICVSFFPSPPLPPPPFLFVFHSFPFLSLPLFFSESHFPPLFPLTSRFCGVFLSCVFEIRYLPPFFFFLFLSLSFSFFLFLSFPFLSFPFFFSDSHFLFIFPKGRFCGSFSKFPFYFPSPS